MKSFARLNWQLVLFSILGSHVLVGVFSQFYPISFMQNLGIQSINAQEIRYFDHAAHGIGVGHERKLCSDGIDNDGDGFVDQKDQGCKRKPQTCVQCHGKKGDRKLDHESCKSCHDLGKIRRKTKNAPYCQSCHLNPTDFRFRRTPPYRHTGKRARFHSESPDGGWSAVKVTFNHERHSTQGTCVDCHKQLDQDQVMTHKKYERLQAQVKRKKRAYRGPAFNAGFAKVTHDACATCHQKAQGKPTLSPQMSECEGCHKVEETAKIAVARATQTTAHFTHWAHTVALDAPLPCQICHTQTGRGADGFIQLPSMSTCETCHNGERAFSVGSSCNRCHQSGIGAPTGE